MFDVDLIGRKSQLLKEMLILYFYKMLTAVIQKDGYIALQPAKSHVAGQI